MIKRVALSVLALAAANASAELLYEPFFYAAGDSIQGKVAPNGFTWNKAGAAAADMPVVSEVSLSYAGLAGGYPSGSPAPTGNSMTYQGSGAYAKIGFSTAYVRPGTTASTDANDTDPSNLYASMVLKVADIGNLTAETFIGGFNTLYDAQDTTPGVPGLARVYLKPGPTAGTYQIGLAKTSGGTGSNPAQYDPRVFTAGAGGDTVFLVIGMRLNPDGSGIANTGANDVATLWVNPAPAQFGAAAQPATALTDAGGQDSINGNVSGIRAFQFRQQANIPQLIIDDLRVDTSWAGVTPSQWAGASGAGWNAAGANWSGGAVPNTPGANVTFGPAGSAQAVAIDAPTTAGTVYLSSPAGYTLSGAAALNLQTPVDHMDFGNINPARVWVQAGANTIAAPLNLGKSAVINTAAGTSLTISGEVSMSGTAKQITAAGTGTVVLGTSSIAAAATPQQLALVGAFSIPALTPGSGVSLDLHNHALVYNFPAADTTTAGAVIAAVKAAYDHGKWDLPGIKSSTAAANADAGTTLGYLDNSTLATPLTTFGGVTIDASTVIVKYTWYGDANLDGKVDAADLTAIGAGGTTWSTGDFNLDGQFTGDDWALFALGMAKSGGQTIGAAVPEPAAAGLLLAATGVVGLRRRRRHS